MVDFINFLIPGLMSGAIYALVAVGFVLIFKATGVLNFAQGELVMFGAYFCFVFLNLLGLPIWVSIIAAIACGGFLGFLIERITIRPLIGQPILSMVMVTIALSVVLSGLAVFIWTGKQRVYEPDFMPRGQWMLGEIAISQAHLISFAVCLIMVIGISVFFQRTKSGLSMRCASEDSVVAQSMGIDVKRISSQTGIMASVASAVGGILLGSIAAVTPMLTYLGLKALPVALLGGLQSLWGAFIGGLIVGASETVVSGYLDPLVGGGLKGVVPYILMVIILLIRPYGIFGEKEIERV